MADIKDHVIIQQIIEYSQAFEGLELGAGEANYGENIGTEGVGVYEGKEGIALQFRKLVSKSDEIAIAYNATNKTLEFTLVLGELQHNELGGVGVYSHLTIDAHLESMANPHGVTHAQLPDKGTNTHAQLDTHVAQTNNPHQTAHEDLQGDIGTRTHTQLESDLSDHEGDVANPHAVTHAQLPDKGVNTHGQIDGHIADGANPHGVTHAQLPDKGTNTHAQLDSHVAATNNPHSTDHEDLGGDIGTKTHTELETDIGDNAGDIGTIITALTSHTTDFANPHQTDHGDLQGDIGTKTHTELETDIGDNDTAITNHVADVANPHAVTHAQLPDKGSNAHSVIDSFLSKHSEISKSISVEDPGAAENISMFFTNKAITITEIRAVLKGSASPSVTWTLRHSPTRDSTGNEVVTGGTVTVSISSGSDVVAFDDATIPADSFVWLETTAKSGTVTELSLTAFATVD